MPPGLVNAIAALPLDHLLDLILRSAGGDQISFAISRGVVYVSTRPELSRMVVTRIYDIDSLNGSADFKQLRILGPPAPRPPAGEALLGVEVQQRHALALLGGAHG